MLKDKDIREPLFDFLEIEYGKTRIIEEKMMGRSRADVVMVITSALVGIEIKSDSDTYARLASQVADYDKYFDYNIVVVGSSHAMHIDEHVPEHWGIITVEEADGAADFYFLRRPALNKKMKLKRKMEILWRPELAKITEHFGMPAYQALSKRKLVDKIIEWTKMPLLKKDIAALEKLQKNDPSVVIPDSRILPEELNWYISELLFERDYEALLAQIKEYRKIHSPRRRGPKTKTNIKRARRRGSR
ncbi:MAG: sce7726 family protein [Pseudobutyrivibrio sp.]|nr:sce7726 family protein [Pseudobutyrivibrio sp.]